MNAAQAPQVIFRLSHFDVRPRPIKAAMVNMIGREFAGDDFAVQTINRVKVRGMTLCFGREFVGNRAVIVNEHWFVAFPHSERVSVDGTGSKDSPTDGGERLVRSAL